MKLILFWGFITTLVIATFNEQGHAQNSYRNIIWGYDQGLPTQSYFHHMLQSDDGYLWFATGAGSLRFDGTEFQLLNDGNSSLPANSIYTLFEDSDERLWYGVGADGIGTLFGEPSLELTGPGYVQRYAETPQGVLWAGTDGNGLWKIDLNAEKPKPQQLFTNELDIYILDLFTGRSGELHVASSNGLFTIREDSLIAYPQISEEGPIYSVWSDSSGGIWYGNEEGLYQLKAGSPYYVRFASKPLRTAVTQINWHPDEGILVLTDQALYTLNEGQLVPIFETGEYVLTCVGTDHEGNIWIGTEAHGIIQLIPSAITTVNEKGGLPGSLTTVVTEGADGTIYVGTTSGLGILRPGSNRFETRFQGSFVTSVLSDRQSRTWVALRGEGIRLIEEDNVRSFTAQSGLLSTAVWTLYEDKSGHIWAGGAVGVATYSDERGWQEAVPFQNKLMNSDVRVINESSSGVMWIGTSFGLHAFTEDTTSVYTTDEGLKSAVILDVAETSDKRLWIATKGGGLYRFSKDTFIQVPESITGSDIASIIPAGDKLWFSGSEGITGINLDGLNDWLDQSENIPDLIRFDQNNGVPGEILGTLQPSGWHMSNNELWFPTSRGVVRFDPETEKLLPLPPPITINYAITGTDTLRTPAALEIPHSRDRIDISYTAFSYANPGAVSYSYRLTDFDEDWNHVGQRRSAVYTNIPPGDYRFEVKARIGNGPYSTEFGSIELMIIPAFYETWWFRLLVISGLGLMLWGVYAWRINALKKVEQLRVRIANDLHDEIGSNLGSIALRSRMLSRRITSGEDQKNLLEIDRISRQTAVAMRDIVWLINPEKDQLEALRFKLKQIASQLLVDIPYEFHTDIDNKDQVVPLHIRQNMIFIFKEMLHNIIKHSGANKVEISFFRRKNSMMLSASDNGKGFDPSGVDGDGIGLNSIRRRCDEMNARLQIESCGEEGTRFEILIPIT